MLAFALTVLAFLAGNVLMYFIMESPRRRANAELKRLSAEREKLEEWSENLAQRSRSASAKEQALAVAADDHARRAEELSTAQDAFEKRVINYDHLAAENRILKTDLKNVAAQIAHQDCQLAHVQTALDSVNSNLGKIGHEYFGEIVSWARKSLTITNYPANKHRVHSAAVRLRSIGVPISQQVEEQAISDLHALYERAVRAAVEREEQARLREKIREEQRREREAQAAIEQAEKERQAIEAALQQALADATGRHAEEIDRLRAQLAEAEARSLRAVSWAEILRSGHVYVISNVGSFGPDVFKIGLTRREDPMERVQELGDASVPFPFDVHLVVTCDDAPRLESELHKRFHMKRLNKVNPRKEFFRVTIDEIVHAVRELHGDVEYRADAEALEFLQSQSMTAEDLKEVEEAFAEAEAAVGQLPGKEDADEE